MSGQKKLMEDEAASYIDQLTSEDINLSETTQFVQDIFKYGLESVHEVKSHNIYEGRSFFLFSSNEPPKLIIKPKNKIYIEERGWELDEAVCTVIEAMQTHYKKNDNIPIKIKSDVATHPLYFEEEEDIFADAGKDYVLEVGLEREKLISDIKPTQDKPLEFEGYAEDLNDLNISTLLQHGQEMASSLGVEPISEEDDKFKEIEPLEMYMDVDFSSDDDEGPSILDANKRPAPAPGGQRKKPKGDERSKFNRDFQVKIFVFNLTIVN